MFEGLHDNIKFVIIQRKLFKGNDWQGEREQTIPQLHMQHFNIAQVNHRSRLRHALTSVLKNPDFNNHMILKKRQFTE